MDEMNDYVLSVNGLRVELDPSGADIDDEVTLAVRKGEVLGLVGETASGKTTVATALLDVRTARRAHRRRQASWSTATTCSPSSPPSCASCAAG